MEDVSPDNIQCDGLQFHVLAVDDSFVDLTVIERLLNLEAFEVATVESGSMALEYLGLSGGEGDTRLEVSMIITDYSMPDMTGFDLLKRIKKSTTLNEIPVVIMSSENVMARIDRCMEEGADDFILKPVKLSHVRRLRKYITRGER